MFNFIKENVFFKTKFLYIAIIHFILTFFTDRFVFEYFSTNEPITPISAIIKTKFVFLLFLIILWQIIAYVIINYKNSIEIKNTLKFAFIYFIIMFLFELLFYPILIGDQMYFIYLYDSTKLIDTGAFTGYFIFYFRIFSLMLIPNFAGIVITQLIIISLIVGYIIGGIYKKLNYSKITYLLYIIFCLPLVIQFNLFIEKDILYTYAIILLIFKLIFMKHENNFSKNNLFFIALNTSIISALRPDGICFLVLPLFYFLIIYKTIGIKKLFLFTFFLILTSCIFYPNYVDTILLDKNGKSYKNSYILNDPFKILLEKAIDENDVNILNILNDSETLNTEYLLSEKCLLGERFYTDLSLQDKQIFDAVAKKLISKYKKTFLLTKFKYLLHLNAIFVYNITDWNDKCFDEYPLKVLNKIKDKIYFININFYKYMVDLLKDNLKKRDYHYTKIYIQIILLFTLLIIFLIKKEFVFSYIIFFVLTFTTILVIFCPYPIFRYFFYLYYLGYLLPFIFLLKIISKKYCK